VSFEGESQIIHDPAARRPSETVSGFLAAIAIFTSVTGIFWHPLRLILPSLAIALIASGMASGKGRLQFASVAIGAVSLFLGLALAVATGHPIW
jgi:hypothetical protein